MQILDSALLSALMRDLLRTGRLPRLERLVDHLHWRGGRRACAGRLQLAQEDRRDVPLLAGLGDQGDGLAAVLGDDAEEHRVTFGLEGHLLADAEVEHAGVQLHLVQELQPRDDAVVQLDEFGFREGVDVDGHG